MCKVASITVLLELHCAFSTGGSILNLIFGLNIWWIQEERPNYFGSDTSPHIDNSIIVQILLWQSRKRYLKVEFMFLRYYFSLSNHNEATLSYFIILQLSNFSNFQMPALYHQHQHIIQQQPWQNQSKTCHHLDLATVHWLKGIFSDSNNMF